VSDGGQVRRRRLYPVEEKLRMVEQTLEPGASVARVAQAHEVNPNLLFLWRRQHREGRLLASEGDRLRLLPVTVVDSPAPCDEPRTGPASAGAIHIELPGRAVISVEGSVDARLVRAVLECLVR
jgi:transposase